MRTAISLAVAAAFSISAQAQDKPKAPPIWHQGKPPAMQESKLAPHAGKMTETPASEIPIDKLKLPPGFKAEIWASGLPGGRAMALGDSGKKLWVGTRIIGRVYEISDEGDKRTVKVLVDKLTQPAGVAFKDGSLYVFAIDKVLRFDGIEKDGKAEPVDMTAKFDLPPEQHHNWKYVAFGPDNKLYVPFGAPCNICEPPEQYAQMRRYNPDGSGKEVIARGIRNSIRRPRSSGSPITAATGWATTARRTSSTRSPRSGRTSAIRTATRTAWSTPTLRSPTPARA